MFEVGYILSDDRCVGSFLHGQFTPEVRPVAEFTLHANLSAELEHYFLADLQSKTGALLEGVELDKALEHLFLFLFADADARVFAEEADAASGGEQVAQADISAVGELGCVGGEIDEHLSQSVGVGGEVELRFGACHPQFDTGLAPHFHRRCHLLAHACGFGVFHLEFERAGLELGEVENVGDEFQQQVVVVVDDGHYLIKAGGCKILPRS